MDARAIVWCQFFANVVAMERHPGKGRPMEAPPLSVSACADVADAMLSEFYKRWRQEALPCPPSLVD